MDLSPSLPYLKTETAFFEALKASLGSRLLLYCVTGSLARNEVLPGWSDIDLLIVVDTYGESALQAVGQTVREHSQDIKIGVTIYSAEEFMGDIGRDTKTEVAIARIRSGLYAPRTLRIALPEAPGTDTRKAMDASEFATYLHLFKRELFAGQAYDERKAYKLGLLLLKILVSLHGKEAYGYADTLSRVREEFPGFDVDLPLPADIVSAPFLALQRLPLYCQLLDWITHSYALV